MRKSSNKLNQREVYNIIRDARKIIYTTSVKDILNVFTIFVNLKCTQNVTFLNDLAKTAVKNQFVSKMCIKDICVMIHHTGYLLRSHAIKNNINIQICKTSN